MAKMREEEGAEGDSAGDDDDDIVDDGEGVDGDAEALIELADVDVFRGGGSEENDLGSRAVIVDSETLELIDCEYLCPGWPFRVWPSLELAFIQELDFISGEANGVDMFMLRADAPEDDGGLIALTTGLLPMGLATPFLSNEVDLLIGGRSATKLRDRTASGMLPVRILFEALFQTLKLHFPIPQCRMPLFHGNLARCCGEDWYWCDPWKLS
ncbi:hypothetical protein BGZ68_005598 [Mortierella alpina]|nr:hypothetical protein BGZ68_005598 [Mortierella alpina]